LSQQCKNACGPPEKSKVDNLKVKRARESRGLRFFSVWQCTAWHVEREPGRGGSVLPCSDRSRADWARPVCGGAWHKITVTTRALSLPVLACLGAWLAILLYYCGIGESPSPPQVVSPAAFGSRAISAPHKLGKLRS
jgi:hypothetical protein